MFELVVRLTSFFGTYGTVNLMSFCLPGSLGLGIILLDFVLTVVLCSTSRLLSATLCLWDSVGFFWDFAGLSTEGLSMDGSRPLHLSDL